MANAPSDVVRNYTMLLQHITKIYDQTLEDIKAAKEDERVHQILKALGDMSDVLSHIHKINSSALAKTRILLTQIPLPLADRRKAEDWVGPLTKPDSDGFAATETNVKPAEMLLRYTYARIEQDGLDSAILTPNINFDGSGRILIEWLAEDGRLEWVVCGGTWWPLIDISASRRIQEQSDYQQFFDPCSLLDYAMPFFRVYTKRDE